MAKKFLTSIDLNGNQLIKPVLENVASNPTNESIEKGRIAFNTQLNKTIVYDGTYWKNLQYEIPAGTYLTKNDTITLSGIVTGTGTAKTSITTSIADGKLSIAKTSGLQDALNAKMITASYPSLTAIQALANTSGFLKKTGDSTWEIDTSTYLLSNENAVSATKLLTGKNFSIKGGVTAEAISFDGSDNVVLDVTAIDPSKITQSTGYKLVTDDEKSAWNAKETPAGAKSKADTALYNAKTYTDEKFDLAIPLTQKGTASGVAELDAEGIIPSSQLPSYVDDVLEFDALADFPTTGESGKIYVAINNNLTYRWTGTTYVEISPSIALGTTSSTAYRGDKGKIAYDHSQTAHAPTNAQKNSDITKAEIEAKLTGAITSHTHSAYVPTSRTVANKPLTGNITLDKDDVGLSNVDNTSDDDKPVSTAQQLALDKKVNNDRVLTDVPEGAKFTDTIVDISGKVDKEPGKGLISTDEITRLSTVENQVVPTKLSEFDNDKGFITGASIEDLGRGDMLKSTYDTNDKTGYVDKAIDSDTASKANELATASNFSIGGETGLTAINVPFNGTEDVALNLKGALGTGYGGTGFTDPKDGITRKVKGMFTTAATSHTITHSLGDDVIAQVFTSSGELVECDINSVTNKVTFGFNVAPTANSLKYVIIG